MASALAHRPVAPPAYSKAEADLVRVIELQASGEYGLAPEKQALAPAPRARPHSSQHFAWRVLVPRVSPRLRGLLLLNLVSPAPISLHPSSSLRPRPARSSPPPPAAPLPAPACCPRQPMLFLRLPARACAVQLAHAPPCPPAWPHHPLSRRAQVCLACASAFVVLKESQENVDPFVFSSLRFVIAAAMFSPFMRQALRDERVVRAGVEIGAWAAGGARAPLHLDTGRWVASWCSAAAACRHLQAACVVVPPHSHPLRPLLPGPLHLQATSRSQSAC